jgi:hypothetical protein
MVTRVLDGRSNMRASGQVVARVGPTSLHSCSCRSAPPYTQGTEQVPALVGIIEEEAGRRDPLGVTVSTNREPTTDPEKCAGGAGLIEIGPASMRYVPSASNVPSARTIGGGN